MCGLNVSISSGMKIRRQFEFLETYRSMPSTLFDSLWAFDYRCTARTGCAVRTDLSLVFFIRFKCTCQLAFPYATN